MIADLDISIKVLGFSSRGQNQNAARDVFLICEGSLDDYFDWQPLGNEMFEGGTPTGEAIHAAVADIIESDNPLSPTIILISDGEPNGENPTYEEALVELQQNCRRACRVALAIQASFDGQERLKQFCKINRRMSEAGFESFFCFC